MFINKLQLKNFKRFTDLTIDLTSPQDENPPKLVLLIGANGSGKSCIFDAFEAFTPQILSTVFSNYGAKNNLSFSMLLQGSQGIRTKSFQPYQPVGGSLEGGGGSRLGEENYKFYGRSAFRYLPRLSKETIGQVKQETISQNLDRPKTYIDLDDKRFENDFDFLVTQIVYEIFNSQIPAQEKLDKINNLLFKVNSSLERIFGTHEKTSLKFREFKTPSGGESAKLLFQKGNSIIHYDFLSAGEKEVINIIFDLYVREPYFKNAIYFFDELDLHLNTSLQFDLLKEITENWIPDNSQVWVASHSLGFIDYARQADNAAIIDFDNLNFDEEQILKPEPKDQLEVYEIAVPKSIITSMMKSYKLVIVENTNAKYFNLALGEQNYLFLPANNNREVFLTIKEDKNKIGLRDKDYLREDEIKLIQEKIPNLKVLNLYNFENYIYHPDNICELEIKDFDKTKYINNITEQKNDKIFTIVSEINDARGHYVEFKDCIKNDKEIETIIEALKSHNFDDFYTFFNMKKYFNREYLNNYQLTVQQLASTNWFKRKISEILQ